jgi:hypothetical protein
MRVAYKRGEEVQLPKPKTRKQVVEEWSKYLIAKWTARDRAKAEKMYCNDRYNRIQS